MPSQRRTYGECVYEQYGYYANFLPVDRVDLGDFGIIEDGAFERLGSLSDEFGITPELAEPSGGASNYEFSYGCTKEVGVGASAKAKVPGISGSISATINFSKSKGIFFSAAGCQTQGLRSLLALQASVIALFGQKRWNPEWVAVSGVVRARSLTLIIGAEPGAAIGLSARGAGPIDFTDVALAGSIRVAKEDRITTTIIGQEATPFLRIAAIRRPPLVVGGIKVVSYKAAAISAEYLGEVRDRVLEAGSPIEEAFEFRELDKMDGFIP